MVLHIITWRILGSPMYGLLQMHKNSVVLLLVSRAPLTADYYGNLDDVKGPHSHKSYIINTV